MHQDKIWLLRQKDIFEANQNIGRELKQILARAHEVKIEVGDDAKEFEGLIEHLPMLRCDAELDMKALHQPKSMEDWRHLYSLGPGAYD